jgi:pimeloyl-ACP methyl ester carboxylesterase
MRRLPGPAAALVLALLLSGCTTLRQILDFEEQAAEARQTVRIDGRVDTEGAAVGTLVVLLARAPDAEGEPPVGVDTFVRVLPGTFRFGVPAGRYRIGAYEDRNGNGLLDLDERVSSLEENPLIAAGPGERITQNIRLKNGTSIKALGFKEPLDILGLVERTPVEQRHFSLWSFSVHGEICKDLDDPAFGPAAGPRGLWEIIDFLNEGIAGIYFMEPYDPKRIPVLFVHGIAGYPQEFSTLIEEIDRERFQPWFYFYPSGFPLDGISTHLATILERVEVEHGFDEIAIVAHSMGGLVSRGAIFKYRDSTQRDDVRLFVSISTPWGGDVKARSAEGAPIELPASFLDMNPSSEYLRWVFFDGSSPRPLPRSVQYHLMFGFKMSGSQDVADDGTVSVASQLRPEVQEQAVTMRGFDHGHVDILHAPEVVARLNLLLDQAFPD